MAYTSRTDVLMKEHDVVHWREEQLRMANIIEDLESRCKMLAAENRQLETMVHKCRKEYDVDTAYLKNQVKNERDRQIQWKELYFKAYNELMELKRQNPYLHSPSTSSIPDVEWRRSEHPPRIRTDSGCQECEEERKRKASESGSPSNRHSCSQSLFVQPVERIIVSSPSHPPVTVHHSPVNKPLKEDIPRSSSQIPRMLPSPDVNPPFTISMRPSQVYEPSDLHHLQSEPKGYFKCQICDQHYNSEQKLRFHMELHSERFLRPVPRSEFSDNRLQVSADFHVCPECNQSFSGDESYRQHLTMHLFKCRFCHITLENEMNYLLHIKSHPESLNMPPFSCFLCDKSFAHLTHLIRHIRAHPDEQPLQCSECGKHFARKGHLTRHMAMHNQARPYTCSHCDKTFAHRTHLRRHEIVHSGLRPHQCKVCHQSFSRKSSLSRHYFIHTTEKPFVCPVCDKGFNRKGRLKNHLKIHIREGYPELENHIIERRPITKEFIEKINRVNADSPKTETVHSSEHQSGGGDDSISVAYDSKDDPLGHSTLDHLDDIKEESDESSCSESDEGEIDEIEADMSEEIGYCDENASTTESNNNNIYKSETTTAGVRTFPSSTASREYRPTPLNS